MHRKYYFLFFLLLSTFLNSCKKLVSVDPPVAYVNNENVYNEKSTAVSVLTGLYVNMVTGLVGNTSFNIGYRTGLSSDELTLFNNVTNAIQVAYYKNKLVSNVNSSIGGEIWTRFHFFLFTCNAAIEGLTASTGLSFSVKQQLLGEAYFLRAFFYFYLVNLYGDIPLILVTDPVITTSLPRANVEEVYKQVIMDLKLAQGLLSNSYLNADLMPYPATSIERVRPTKWAATALLARTYLFTKDYANSEIESSKIISETSLYDTMPLSQVFQRSNNKEAIWQLQPIRTGRNSEDAFLYILPNNGPNATANPVYLSNSLLASFKPGDKRGLIGNWVGRRVVGAASFYFGYKYKSTTGVLNEYPVVLRLSEQFLIRAEARARLNRLEGANGAANDLNIVRSRAGLPNIVVANQDKMLEDIFNERRVELFLEWGHRWLDIKRSSNANSIMSIAAFEKGTVWEPYQQLYPLPFKDLQSSPVLQQNNGYIK